MASRKQLITGCLMGFTLLSILFFATSNYSFSFSFSANSHPLKLDSGDMSGKYFAYEDVEDEYRGSEGDVEDVAVYRGSEGTVVPDVLTPAPERVRVDEEQEGRVFPQLDMTTEPATTPTTATTATTTTSATTATTTESTTPTTEPTSTSEPESDYVAKRGAQPDNDMVLEPAPNQTSPNPEVDPNPEQSGSQPDNPKPIDSNNQTDLNPGPNSVEQPAPELAPSKANEAETDTSPNTTLSDVASSDPDKGLEIVHLPEELSDSDEDGDSILNL